MRKEYLDQVALLIETLPSVGKLGCFALKDGTAIKSNKYDHQYEQLFKILA